MSDKDYEELVKEKESISFKKLFNLFISNWYWFLISVIVCTCAGYLYLKTKPPVYQRTAQLLIKDEDNASSSAGNLVGLSGMDIFNQTSNLWNELAVIKSPDLMEKVVKELNLNNAYMLKGTFYDKSLYADSIPLLVNLKDSDDVRDIRMNIAVAPNGAITLSKFKINYKNVEGAKDIQVKLGEVVKTPIGELSITATPKFAKEKKPFEIIFRHWGSYNCALNYCSGLNASVIDNKSSVIELSINDVSIKRADDIINELIDEYNKAWLEDKNQISRSTAHFIDDRLAALEKELSSVDNNISDYKSANLLPDVTAASNMYMNQAREANDKIVDVSTQIYIAEYLRDYIANASPLQTLPSNSAFNNPAVGEQIKLYNQKVLERNKMASVSGESNPALVDMDVALKDLKSSIYQSINNEIVLLQDKKKNLEKYEGEAVSQISSNPEQARYLLSVERQQKVKEELYIFLLQQREENDLSQKFGAFNTRIIVKPNGLPGPVSPKKNVILIFSFLMGLVIPFVILILRERMITTVRSRKDIETLPIPFLGEIPLDSDKKGKKGFKKNEDYETVVAVKKGSRNVINEAFRILRTNLSLMTGKNSTGNVVSVVSINPGSGKSFLSFNLAMTYAFRDKKVLVIDGDLRHGSTSRYVGSPFVGLTDYLAGDITEVSDIKVAYPDMPNLEVIPIGKIPPNPTELLENGRLDTLIAKLRGEYDYIFIDCPPVEIVADTQIIEEVSDRSIFVIRAGVFRLDSIPDLEDLYREKRIKNMSVVLNGTALNKSGYYSTGRRSYYYSQH